MYDLFVHLVVLYISIICEGTYYIFLKEGASIFAKNVEIIHVHVVYFLFFDFLAKTNIKLKNNFFSIESN